MPLAERYDLEGLRSQQGAKVRRTPGVSSSEIGNGQRAEIVPGNEDWSSRPNGLVEEFGITAKRQVRNIDLATGAFERE